MTEAVRCRRCGSDVEAIRIGAGRAYAVECAGDGVNQCWMGPECDTEEQANIEWNKLMEVKP